MITVKQTIKEILMDLPERSIRILLRCYIYDGGFRILLNYRIGKYCYQSKFSILRHLARYYKLKLITKRNCDISYKAIIGEGVRFPHPIGIVIGDQVIIKNNVKIWQQVTLGSHGKESTCMAYPIIDTGVKIFAGAKIFGKVHIGCNAVIGANSVVNVDVPDNCTAVGIPCKIIYRNK